jgi:hypothetical protein
MAIGLSIGGFTPPENAGVMRPLGELLDRSPKSQLMDICCTNIS